MEKQLQAKSGYGMLFLTLTLLAAGGGVMVFAQPWAFILGTVILLTSITLMCGLATIEPGQSLVLVLFGEYKGTIRQNGFVWFNPFLTRKKVTLRAQNLNGATIKVNDQAGNPIEIATVVVWQVHDTAQAIFAVEDYANYVKIQSEAALRHLANSHSYDNQNHETNPDEITLRDGGERIIKKLEDELNERLAPAGINVMEARLSHLAYAPEIASAMLQRQQAAAIVSARKLIVDGAVGMVELALERLQANNVVDLDPERKAAMVSNLLVVLCSERAANPVVNAGTLYH